MRSALHTLGAAIERNLSVGGREKLQPAGRPGIHMQIHARGYCQLACKTLHRRHTVACRLAVWSSQNGRPARRGYRQPPASASILFSRYLLPMRTGTDGAQNAPCLLGQFHFPAMTAAGHAVGRSAIVVSYLLRFMVRSVGRGVYKTLPAGLEGRKKERRGYRGAACRVAFE